MGVQLNATMILEKDFGNYFKPSSFRIFVLQRNLVFNIFFEFFKFQIVHLV